MAVRMRDCVALHFVLTQVFSNNINYTCTGTGPSAIYNLKSYISVRWMKGVLVHYGTFTYTHDTIYKWRTNGHLCTSDLGFSISFCTATEWLALCNARLTPFSICTLCLHQGRHISLPTSSPPPAYPYYCEGVLRETQEIKKGRFMVRFTLP